MMRKKILFSILLSILYFLTCDAQFQKKVVKIESWETLEINKSQWHIDTLIVKGTFIVKDRRNIKISVGTIIVDGGLFQIGTPENPFRNKIAIQFNQPYSDLNQNNARFIVKNNGRVSMYGSSGEKTIWSTSQKNIISGNNTLQLKDISNWQRDDKVLISSNINSSKNEIATLQSAFNKEATIKETFIQNHIVKSLAFKKPFTVAPHIALLTHSILITAHPNLPSNTLNTQIIIEESAGKVSFSGVEFSNLGTRNQKEPLFKLLGRESNNSIKNSSIHHIASDVINIDNSSMSINNNVFFSNEKTTIICSPSGMGTGNKITNNLIIYESYTNNINESGIKIMNPYQTIRGNHIIGPRFVTGISYYRSKDSITTNNKNSQEFVLENNFIHGLFNLKSSNSGIYLSNLPHDALWKMNNNTVVNYSKGISIDTDNIALDEFKSYNNTIGIAAASGIFTNAEILNPDERLFIQSRAIDLKSDSKLTPKMSNIAIDGYDIGISIEGNLDATNSFEKINFKNVKKRLSIENIDLQSYLKDIDASFNIKKSSLQESILVPQNSFLRYDECTPIDSKSEIYSCDFNNYGTLLVSTGKGLDIPLENEYYNTFQGISIKKGNFDLKLAETTNKKRFFIPQNNEYSISFNNNNPIADISLEWTSPQRESTTIVSFPYTYEKIFGLRSFGGLLKEASSINILKNSNELSFFFNKEQKRVYVKLFNRKNHNKIVVYASDYQNGKFPYKLTYNKKKKKFTIAYIIEKGATTSLFIKDINGKTIKSLINGPQKRKSIEVTIDIDQLNLKNELRFYELTINGKLYREPLYVTQ